MKRQLAVAMGIVLAGISLAWAGHFTETLPPASASGCMPVSNGYDYNCTTDSGAPKPTLNGATVTGAVTQTSGVVAISTTNVTGGLGLWSQTLAQLQALTPTTTGQLVFCSNCANTNVCISSGSTAAGAWVTLSTTGTVAGAAACK